MGTFAGAAGFAAAKQASARASRKLRVGVVGSGHRARGSHLPILRTYFPRTELVALCDITPENLDQGLAICGAGAAGYGDHREMLASHPELAAVVVVVPNYKHVEVALDALEAGKHVLSEKPMATRLADASRMIRKAQEKRVILQIGHQMRYGTIFHKAAELIRDGQVGTVDHAGILIEFENEAKCEFAFTLFTPRLRERRVMRFMGSEGELRIEADRIVTERCNGRAEEVPVARLPPEQQTTLARLGGQQPRKSFDVETYREHLSGRMAAWPKHQPWCSTRVPALTPCVSKALTRT